MDKCNLGYFDSECWTLLDPDDGLDPDPDPVLDEAGLEGGHLHIDKHEPMSC